jgi:hypothetical protein
MRTSEIHMRDPYVLPLPDFWSNTQFWAPECHPWKGRYYLFASFAKDERQRSIQILVADRPETARTYGRYGGTR